MPDVDCRGYSAVGLYRPKTPANVGSTLRAAACYNAAMVAVEGTRDIRAATDTPKAYRQIPTLRGTLKDLVPFDCVPVAVELVDGALDLTTYWHPERAFYIFGPEDGTLGRPTLEWCQDVVYVPTQVCMNLAATVNVVLYDRLTKRGRRA